jgi:hypothetical protein
VRSVQVLPPAAWQPAAGQPKGETDFLIPLAVPVRTGAVAELLHKRGVRMGWERRGNREYYYRATRVGGRVVKEYVPPLVAEAAALMDQGRREQRAAAAAAMKDARDELAALDAELAPLCELADALARGALLAAGYHRHHRGPWRKRRDRPADPAAGQEGEPSPADD